MKAVLLLCCLALASASYEGFKVVRAHIEHDNQTAEISSWELDVWSRESSLEIGWNDIVVNDNNMNELLTMGVPFNILIDNLQAHLDDGRRDLEESRRTRGVMLDDFFLTYHTYDEYAAYLLSVATLNPLIATYIPAIGTSIEGRAIFAFKVTGPATGSKKKIFVSSGQHAREWIAPATTTYILTQLVTQYGINDTVTALLNSFEIHFVPLVNPDGYFYTWATTVGRLWVKNRRLNNGGSIGVDLNRNWNDHWGQEGASKSPTSDTYCGTAPFSEPETMAVSTYITVNGPFYGAIDYHSYSQLILRPYGWTAALPPNDALSKTVGDTIRAQILSVNNVAYTSEPSWQVLDTSGTATDWFYSQASIPLCYTIVLRDTGTYGFQLPASQIKPTGAENFVGFVAFAQAVIANT